MGGLDDRSGYMPLGIGQSYLDMQAVDAVPFFEPHLDAFSLGEGFGSLELLLSEAIQELKLLLGLS